jgi:hypothetical protein
MMEEEFSTEKDLEFDDGGENKLIRNEVPVVPKETLRSKYLYCLDFPFSVWFIFANEFGERYCFYGFYLNILNLKRLQSNFSSLPCQVSQIF